MGFITGLVKGIFGQAAGEGVNALIGGASASEQARRQYEYQSLLQLNQQRYNSREAQLAYERQLDFWRTQQEYNTPANQRARLTEAGLNPALLYGGGASGVSTAGGLSSVSAAQSGQGSATGGQPTSVHGDPLVVAQMQEIESRTDLNEAQAENIRNTTPTREQYDTRFTAELGEIASRTSNTDASTALTNVKTAFETATFDTNIEERKKNLEEIGARIEVYMSEKAVNEQDVENKRMALKVMTQDYVIKCVEAKYAEQLTVQELNLLKTSVARAKIDVGLAQNDLNNVKYFNKILSATVDQSLVELEKAKKENNWFVVDRIAGYLNGILQGLGTGIGVGVAAYMTGGKKPTTVRGFGR